MAELSEEPQAVLEDDGVELLHEAAAPNRLDAGPGVRTYVEIGWLLDLVMVFKLSVFLFSLV